MRKNPRLFRLTATVALTALLWDTALPLAAVAQPAPPPLPAQGEGRPDLNQNQGDPPARVGRIASMTGPVSFHNLGDTQWSAASTNYPVSSGNALWTEPSSAARLEISDSRVVMAGGTEFDVATLDATGLQGVAAQGEVYIHLRDLAPNEVWSIQTPRGLVRLSAEGRYGIVVGTTDQPTLVTVMDGAAQIDGAGVSLQVAANQTATITGADTFQGSVGPAQRDEFLTVSLNAERPRPAAAAPLPAQVYAMAGGSDLDGSGSWSEAPQYGRVWYPPVPATWVPYREGHWAYVAPWGWTWVDDASWGFAPFHYGRWIQVGGRWAWTPGEAVVERPVYAPALVTFIGIGTGVALGAALASGSIGWVPLGPREEFHPWYHASNNYVRQVNVAHVTNVTNVTTNNVTINNYVNRGAATSIPAAAMVASRPIQGVARPVTAQEFAAARPIAGQQPIHPTAATAGVTPVVARQLNLAPAAAVARPAPGPAVRPVGAGATGFGRPTFAPAGRVQAPGAAEPGRPVPGTPGARPTAVPTPGAAEPGRPVPGTPGARPAAVPTPGAAEPGRPVPGTPPQGLPNVVRPEGARPGGVPTPEAGRPAGVATPGGVPQTAPRPVQPGAARPELVPTAPPSAPRASTPEIRPGIVRPEPQPAARSAAPAAIPAAPLAEPQHVAPPAPRAEPQHVAAPPPRVEPQHIAAPAPRVEPQHVAAPPPRVEPQHVAPPAPRAEPQHIAAPAPHPAAPAHPEPQERKKQPGEH
ncbi:MAG: hypothetical protein JWQ55_5660 [Rhodopila sp.]|nr:hypothetical protein [Rhodopila sp.]